MHKLAAKKKSSNNVDILHVCLAATLKTSQHKSGMVWYKKKEGVDSSSA
jgi:hypothetical protein